MTKVLFIVHVETLFEQYFTYMYREEIYEAATNGFDRVIALESGFYRDGVIDEIRRADAEIWEWAWGYYPDEAMLDEIDWVIPTDNVHEWTWIPYELRQEAGYLRRPDVEVYVCGGARSECLWDWEAALLYLEIDYTRIEELCWG